MNFNPAGAPYNGSTDTDKADTYPNEIRGLVHVEGSSAASTDRRHHRRSHLQWPDTCEGTNTITYTPSLYACPPKWYTYVDGMKVSPASWKQVVE